MINLHSKYYAKSMLTVISYLCSLNPQFLSVPVSTIDYDSLFKIAVYYLNTNHPNITVVRFGTNKETLRITAKKSK